MLMKVNLKLRKPAYPEAAAQPKLRVSRLKKREVTEEKVSVGVRCQV